MKKNNYNIPKHNILKELDISQLRDVAIDIRGYMICNISKTGGHIGANLGTIELTLAIHCVFDSPSDRIIFDTGHQGYTHKLLTGRKDLLPTLNSWGGMSRFLSKAESEHDIIEASHAGTSIAIASGIAQALKDDGIENHIVAVIGDGSLVEGMAFEGLNFSADKNLNLIIILNDNGMAIAPNVGGLLNLTSDSDWRLKAKAFFEGLGFNYLSVHDGHNLEEMIDALNTAKEFSKVTIVHIKTEKGKGLHYAKKHPYKMHFSMPFIPETGEGASPTVAGKTYAVVASEVLEDKLKIDNDIYVITPATPYASSLDNLIQVYPDRVIDVGMAEQHAVGMACGLALNGKKPVVCFQSTFMQRAFDQIIHDACFMNLPVTFLCVRSGFSGYDSPTHHGIYDIAYLRSIPNLQIVYPTCSRNMQELLSARLDKPEGPMVILHPYEPIIEPEVNYINDGINDLHIASEGVDGVIITLGNQVNNACKLRDLMMNEHNIDFGVACVQSIKPVQKDAIVTLCKTANRVITIEENTLPGGFGSLICEVLLDNKVKASVFRAGVKDCFVPAGSKEECLEFCLLTPELLLPRVIEFWPDLKEEKSEL